MTPDSRPTTPHGVVVGVDSSTQSCKVVVVDAATGQVLTSASAPHPDGTAVDPRRWLEALRSAWAKAGVAERPDVLGVGISAQQHGLVALDASGEPVHEALLWNDVRSAEETASLYGDLGTPAWLDAVGLVPVPAITLTKLAWLRRHRPEAAERVHRVMLPHDWLVLQLTGAFVTDASDASGTGYFSAQTGAYRPDLLQRYFGAVPALPEVLAPDAVAGHLHSEWAGAPDRRIPVSAGSGDNAGAALGLGLAPGDVVVSVGTSGTVFSRSPHAVSDPTGLVSGFADATGHYLPLLCTLNAARVMTTTADLLGVDLAEFTRLGLAGPSDAAGLTMLPYLDGERTPNLPDATGRLHGITRASFTPENLARAAVLSVANSLADCLEVLRGAGAPVERVLAIGGGAQSDALRAVLPDTLGTPVQIPEIREYVALGAAHQALWAAAGEAPAWPRRLVAELPVTGDAGIRAHRERYRALRQEAVSPAGR